MAPQSTEIIRAESSALDLPTLAGWFAQVLALAEMHTIETQDDLELAGEMLAEVTAKAKAIALMKKTATDPIARQLADERGRFIAIEGSASLASQVWKKKISEGTDAMKQRTAAAVQRAAQAMQERDAEGVASAVAVIRLPQKTATFQEREVWDFEIKDEAALPREFLTPDVPKIRKAMANRCDGTPLPIPGVRFFQKKVVAATG